MIAKQDRVQARTPAQLEQKYDFGKNLNAENSKLAIQVQQLNQNLSQFMVDTMIKFDSVDEAAAKSIQTWFGSGVPTLDNQPAVQWVFTNTEANHIGDIYCNEEDGSIYLFKGESDIYSWVKCFQGVLEKQTYNVFFYDENNIVIAGYVITPGAAINPPVEEAMWVDSSGGEITFPYTPTSDTYLYITNEKSTL